MNEFAILGTLRRRALYALILAGMVILTLAAALRYAIPMEGIPWLEVGNMNAGWYVEAEGCMSQEVQLPCELEYSGRQLYLVHDLTGAEPEPEEVLAVQTRYQALRVWADGTLIYESARGEDYALSSMWHFIPSESYRGADTLRIELTKYEQWSDWSLLSILQDHPDAVGMYLLRNYLPSVLVWLCCMLFSLLLFFVISLYGCAENPEHPAGLSTGRFHFSLRHMDSAGL